MKRLALPILLFAAAGAHADITSTFDSNDDGWTTAAVNQSTFDIIATGTASAIGGQLHATEILGGVFVLVAPSKYIGDKSSLYGGTASYSLADETQNVGSFYNLILYGGGTAISYPTLAPTVSGRNYTIPLTQTGWVMNTSTGIVPVPETTFRSVLSNLQVFAINGDWTGDLGNGNYHTDVVTLDNVIVAAPVPEPVTFAALGLGALAVARRRRR